MGCMKGQMGEVGMFRDALPHGDFGGPSLPTSYRFHNTCMFGLAKNARRPHLETKKAHQNYLTCKNNMQHSLYILWFKQPFNMELYNNVQWQTYVTAIHRCQGDIHYFGGIERDRIAFVEVGPRAVGARHRFLRASYALRMLWRNPRPD